MNFDLDLAKIWEGRRKVDASLSLPPQSKGGGRKGGGRSSSLPFPPTLTLSTVPSLFVFVYTSSQLELIPTLNMSNPSSSSSNPPAVAQQKSNEGTNSPASASYSSSAPPPPPPASRPYPPPKPTEEENINDKAVMAIVRLSFPFLFFEGWRDL